MNRKWMGLWLSLVATAVGAADVPGSRDLPMVERPDGAEIVRYREAIQTAIVVPLDRVQRVNNRIEIGAQKQLEGHVTDVTYLLSPREGYLGYLKALERRLTRDGAEMLWGCESRACGISGLWANSLFDVRELYGPNGNQAYFAFAMPDAKDRVLMVYGIEQGNRRQYVHLRLIEPDVDQRTFKGATELLARGRVVLPVLFAGDRVSPESRDLFDDMAANLRELRVDELAIVAHRAVTPGGTLEQAIAQSTERAEHVQELLAEAGLTIDAVFGVGALVPAEGLSPERVEIVRYR